MQKHINLDNPSIRILVTGRTGVGKSTLVNALLGAEVATTGDTLMGGTEKIEATKDGIHMSICDTPGFETIGMDDIENLHSVLGECKNIDLFLFCLRMTDEKFDSYQSREMELMSSAYGRDVWQKGMIILTHANEMLKETSKFISQLHEWQDAIRDQLIDYKLLDTEVVEKIPIVPTGFKEPQLPDRPSWVSEFWVQGFRRMGFKPMLYLILLNRNRMHSATDGMKQIEDISQDQPLITCHMSQETFERSIDPKHFLLLSGFVGSIIGSLVGRHTASIPMAAFTGASFMGIANVLYQSFGWAIKETEVNCYEEALAHSLIASFLEEYPEYLLSPEYQEYFLNV